MDHNHGSYLWRSSLQVRVRFSTPEIDVAGTSRAADAHSPDLPAETQPALTPAAVPEEV